VLECCAIEYSQVSTLLLWIAYALLGLVVGVLAGLFGVGGGTILVPVLMLVFAWQDFPVALHMHMAVGTSLACIVFTSLSATWQHHQHGAVRWPLVIWLAPGLCLGVWCGAAVAARLPGVQLAWFFGLFCWVVAAQMATGWQPVAARQLPGRVVLGVAGSVIGLVSAFFGIGGGSLTVPFLAACRVRMQEAVATAAACGFPIALVGAAGYAWQGRAVAYVPEWSTGYVYGPAFMGIAVVSVFSARVGAHWAHRLDAIKLKRAFAAFLFLIGATFLWPQ
jgi:uncharacterized membrane protein YfcA